MTNNVFRQEHFSIPFVINFPLFSHLLRLEDTSATVGAGKGLICWLYDRGVTKQGGGGGAGGHGIAGAAVKQAPVQVGARGGQELQTFDALVTGLVILFPSLIKIRL